MSRVVVLAGPAFPVVTFEMSSGFLPAGGWNCPFQRSRFACELPPWPCPKKKITSSASPFLPGIANCLSRIGLETGVSFQEGGGVDLRPPSSTGVAAANSETRARAMIMRPPAGNVSGGVDVTPGRSPGRTDRGPRGPRTISAHFPRRAPTRYRPPRDHPRIARGLHHLARVRGRGPARG